MKAKVVAQIHGLNLIRRICRAGNCVLRIMEVSPDSEIVARGECIDSGGLVEIYADEKLTFVSWDPSTKQFVP